MPPECVNYNLDIYVQYKIWSSDYSTGKL